MIATNTLKPEVQRNLDVLLALPEVQAELRKRDVVEATERMRVFEELDRHREAVAASVAELSKRHSAAQGDATKAHAEYIRRATEAAKLYGEMQRISLQADAAKGRLEARLRELGNGAIENAIQAAQQELRNARSLRQSREQREYTAYGVAVEVVDVTPDAVLDAEARLNAAVNELQALLLVRDLSPKQLNDRIRDISATARLGREADWNPHAAAAR